MVMLENTKAAVAIEPRRPRGRPRAEDLSALESRLVRVAFQSFVAHGYGATSMAEVARAARVSKTTLYSRFPSKADLFRAIVDDQIQHAGRRVENGEPKPRTLEAMLKTYAERMLGDSLDGEFLQLNRLIYSEAGRFPELGEAAWARARVGVGQVSELIKDYAVIEGIPCADPEGAAEVFLDMLRGWYSGAMLRNRAVSVIEIRAATDKMLKLFMVSRHVW